MVQKLNLSEIYPGETDYYFDSETISFTACIKRFALLYNSYWYEVSFLGMREIHYFKKVTFSPIYFGV